MLYETTLIIDGYLHEEKQVEIVSKVEKLIEEKGGKVSKTERMGKRRLAYEISKKQHGYYIYMLYDADSVTLVSELEREFRFNEGILRYLTVKVHKDSPQFKAFYSPEPEEISVPAAAEPEKATVEPEKADAEPEKATEPEAATEPAKADAEPEKATAEPDKATEPEAATEPVAEPVSESDKSGENSSDEKKSDENAEKE